MRKLLYIVGGLAVFFTIGLFLLLWWTLSKSELEKNRSRTQAARDARWKRDNTPNLEGKSEEEVNKILDELNENKKTDEEKTEGLS